MNYISKIFAILLAVILLFIVPAYRMYWIVDQAVIKEVDYETQNFVNNIRHKGYISRQMFEDYMNRLSKTGYIYDVELKHSRKVYYPLKPGDSGYSADNTFTVYDDEYHTKQILDTIYNLQTDYRMKSGDDFCVVISNRTKTGSMVFLNLIGKNGNTPMISGRFGGMVTNEDY